MAKKEKVCREELLRRKRVYQKKYRAEHPERLRAERKKYRESHRAEMRAWSRAWHVRHPHYQREYYRAHRVRVLAQQKAWRVRTRWKQKKKPLTAEQKLRKRLYARLAYQRLSPAERVAKKERARQYRIAHKEQIALRRNAQNAEQRKVQRQVLPMVFEQVRRKLMRKSYKALKE